MEEVPSLVSSKRPHMFAKEIVMYLDHFEKLIDNFPNTSNKIKMISECKKNLEEGLDFCLEIAQKSPYPGENLESLSTCVKQQKRRLESLYARFKKITL